MNLLATVAVIGILSGVALKKLSNTRDSSKDTAFQSQVASLNASVQLYLALGGSLEGVYSPESVVAKLKTVASNGEKVVGFRGNFVDPRLEVVWQTPEEAAELGLRAIWNAAEERFLMVWDGVQGIKEFTIKENSTATYLAEERDSYMQFSVSDQTGNWVWDFDRTTVDTVTQAMTTTTVGGEDEDPDIVISTKEQLSTPLFNPESSNYPADSFPLTVELLDPNAAGSAMVYYSVNGSSYNEYTAPFEVGEDTVVTAFSQPLGSDNYASFTRTEFFGVSGADLLPPVFTLASESCCETAYPKTLTLTNPNLDSLSSILYTLDGGAEQVYEGPITLAGNTEVVAYCLSEEAEYNNSETITEFYESNPLMDLEAPAISPGEGVYQDFVMVSLAAGVDAPEGSRIFYTTDGSQIQVDEFGEPINGTLYTEDIVLEYSALDVKTGDYSIDWDSSVWNDGQGWLDNQWDITQTLTDIGGSGIDLNVSLHGGPPTGDVPGPNLATFSPLGLETNLRSTAGDLPDFYYSLSFSKAVQLQDFATAGLFTYFDEMLANKIDLFDVNGNQIALDTSYVTSIERARLDIKDDGIETVGTSVMDDPIIDAERSTTYYDFGGLGVSEMRWWHYAYEVPGPETIYGTNEPVAGAQVVTVGNDTVTFAGVLYDYPQEGQSSWFYYVESGEQPEISHVLFDVDDDMVVPGGVNGAGTWSGSFPNVSLNSGDGDPEIGPDRKTAAWGIKYDEGISAYNVRNYYFTVDGNYERTSIPVFTKAGRGADQAPITGPGLAVALNQSVMNFTVVDANTNQPVPGYEVLEDGMELDLAYMPTNFTIRANLSPTVVGSVRFDLDGETAFKVENFLPYALMGDTNGDYAPWNPTLGTHSLQATPFTESNLGGTAGIPGFINFTIINTANTIGHDKSSFLSDIAFHVDGKFTVVAQVFPPAGDPQCKLHSPAVRREFILTEPEVIVASDQP